MDGIRLINRGATNTFLSLPDMMIQYSPSTRWQTEITNEFDPTYVHRRGRYYVDSFSIDGPVTPSQYYLLLDILKMDGQLYVEYTSSGTLRQYPVSVVEMPPAPDDLHEYREIVKFSLEARYITQPGIVNWDTFSLADTDETLVIV